MFRRCTLSLALFVASVACGGSPPTRPHVPETGTRSVHANGLEFHYLEDGEGPLVVLLHGFPDTAHTWDDVRPALARAGYRAVSPFMRGYAPTEVPATDPDARVLGQDVLALIEALGEESAIVVGHDWGASAAYAAAHLGPEKVDKLVTVAIPHPASIQPAPGLLWSGRHFFYLNRGFSVGLMQKDDFAHVDTLYHRWSPTWDVPAGELDAVKNTFASEPSLNAALGYYRAADLEAPAFMQTPLAMPSLLVGGHHDLLPESAYTEDTRPMYMGDYAVVMLDAGHFPHREDPEAFQKALLEFVGPAPRPPAEPTDDTTGG